MKDEDEGDDATPAGGAAPAGPTIDGGVVLTGSSSSSAVVPKRISRLPPAAAARRASLLQKEEPETKYNEWGEEVDGDGNVIEHKKYDHVVEASSFGGTSDLSSGIGNNRFGAGSTFGSSLKIGGITSPKTKKDGSQERGGQTSPPVSALQNRASRLGITKFKVQLPAGGAQGLNARQFDHETGPEEVNYHISSEEDSADEEDKSVGPQRVAGQLRGG
ncbi:unnamed protein product, partial [Amoebophrya sp. A120]|eukprot:GSA120T00016424001.1